MSEPIEQVANLAGCSKEEAQRVYEELQDVVLSVDRILTTPSCSGSRYIPPKKPANQHLSEEQRERCERGRRVTDTINADRSSAYLRAKRQTDQVEAAGLPLESAPVQPENGAPNTGSS